MAWAPRGLGSPWPPWPELPVAWAPRVLGSLWPVSRRVTEAGMCGLSDPESSDMGPDSVGTPKMHWPEVSVRVVGLCCPERQTRDPPDAEGSSKPLISYVANIQDRSACSPDASFVN